jgi:16S rRNA (adenine1518-N6/adenine1519-N6)-dimethyltransferase
MDIHTTLARLGLDPKKSLGQNFMIEAAALRKMIDAADLTRDDAVLEIGPGLGALTDQLAEHARRVVAVEIDQRFVPYLTERYARDGHVEIVEADILDADVCDLLGEDAGHYKVIANLPYYITSAILRLLLEGNCPPDLLTITVQHEVAQRIAAKPGEMSLLAVGVQFYGVPKIAGRLKPGNFYPAPNVDSAVVRIMPHAGGPPLTGAERERFFTIARAGFSQPRKQLRNSLAAGLHLPAPDVVDWMAAAGIDTRRRPETLTIAEWLALFHSAPASL